MFKMKRFIGYLIGLVLFYAPFALYQKFIFYLLGKKNYADIHDFCLRIPLEHIWRGRIFDQFTIETITTVSYTHLDVYKRQFHHLLTFYNLLMYVLNQVLPTNNNTI